MKRSSNISALIVLALMLVLLPSYAYAQENLAQNRVCLPNAAINGLVQSNQIASFSKVKRLLQLKKGSKIFNQRLCQVDGKFVYFFKVVDPKGNARAMALTARDGKPFPNKG